MFDLAGRAKMGKDAAVIRDEFRIRLGQIARELGRDPYPDGLPRGTKFSEEFVRVTTLDGRHRFFCRPNFPSDLLRPPKPSAIVWQGRMPHADGRSSDRRRRLHPAIATS